MASAANAVSARPRGADGTVFDDEIEDDYDDYNDDRPTPDPIDRPTTQRSERPMRSPTASRWGPSRYKNR